MQSMRINESLKGALHFKICSTSTELPETALNKHINTNITGGDPTGDSRWRKMFWLIKQISIVLPHTII